MRQEVDNLVQDIYPGNRVIVTAREAGYREEAVFGDDFTRLDVQDLDEDQIATVGGELVRAALSRGCGRQPGQTRGGDPLYQRLAPGAESAAVDQHAADDDDGGERAVGRDGAAQGAGAAVRSVRQGHHPGAVHPGRSGAASADRLGWAVGGAAGLAERAGAGDA